VSAAEGGPCPPFPDDAARELLALARQSIVLAFSGEPPPAPAATPGAVAEPRGAFVTLEKAGRLRGCIGRIESSDPLWRTVVEMARAAAFEDPRFPPLAPAEIEEVCIELSVLTPPHPLADPAAEVAVGRHGLIVQRGPARGLLLPQVAERRSWDAPTFLAEACRKAGLPPDAWRHRDTRVWAFRADVFTEAGA
jgi:AmmeMemoRadiSam system protein A